MTPGDSVTFLKPDGREVTGTVVAERTDLVLIRYHLDGAVSEAWVNRQFIKADA